MIEAPRAPLFDELGRAPSEPPPTPFATVDALAAFVPALRDDDGLLDVAVAAYRHLGFAQATLLRALAELQRRFAAESPPTPLGREPLLDVAGEFSLEALARGQSDLAKAKVVAEVTAARAFATDARWRRLITDDMDGSLLDVGTRSYRPPKHLDRFVKIRDMTCIAPSCDRDARTCQIDHTQNYPDGPTAEGNLGSPCATDHNRKTRRSVTLDQVEPGVFT